MSLGERMSIILAGSLLAKLLPRSLFGDRCSRGKVVECRVEREVSQTSQLRLYHCKRCAPPRDSLLRLAAAAVAAHIDENGTDALWALPPDCAQLVLDALIASGELTFKRLACFGGQPVYRLDLADFPTIKPEWLRLLRHAPLCSVSLRNCNMMGDAGMAYLGGHYGLTKLDLGGCIRLTNAGLASVTRLTSLRELSLDRCEVLTSVAPLVDLTRLEALSLALCSRLTGLCRLSRLQRLKRLDLGWCSAVSDSDVAVLARLPVLMHLQLARVQAGARGLTQLAIRGRQLRVLGLAGCRVSARGGTEDGMCNAALAAFAQCAAQRRLECLRTLDLEHCRLLTARGMAVLGALVTLQDLSVANTAAGDASLAAWGTLTALTRLNLDSTAVTDRGLLALGGLTQMRALDLSDTAVTSAGMPAMARMRGLHTLSLSFGGGRGGVCDAGLAVLTVLTGLADLNLDSRKFSDAGLSALAPLTGLRRLDIYSAHVTNAGCAALRAFTALEELELCGGGVGDAGARELGGLGRLRVLSLANNVALSDRASPHLARLTALRELNLSGARRLTGNGILPFQSLQDLEVLMLRGTRVRQAAADRLRVQLPRLHTAAVDCHPA